MPGGTRRSALSVALMSVGVIVVTAGLATTQLPVVAAGVAAIVAGWLAASGMGARASQRDG
ncbi:MAG TPA: hypothetical protein VGL44_07735 [Gaiellales bacterium]